MARRFVLEIVAVLACIAIVRDSTVALDLLLRDRWPSYASLGVASIVAIWLVVLATVAVASPQGGRTRIRPPDQTLTLRSALVMVGIMAVTDWLFDFRLARVVGGQLPIHIPSSWLSFAAIAFGGPVVEEWLFRGVLWDAIASRTRAPASTLAPIVISSLLFGVSHSRWMLAPSWLSPSGTPVVLHVAFGACMAVLRWRFRSIGPGLIVHGLWNGLYPLTV